MWLVLAVHVQPWCVLWPAAVAAPCACNGAQAAASMVSSTRRVWAII